MKTPNQYLKECRVKKGLTQAQLAKKLKIHTQFVSNIERGACGVPRKRLKKWIKEVGADSIAVLEYELFPFRKQLIKDLGL